MTLPKHFDYLLHGLGMTDDMPCRTEGPSMNSSGEEAETMHLWTKHTGHTDRSDAYEYEKERVTMRYVMFIFCTTGQLVVQSGTS